MDFLLKSDLGMLLLHLDLYPCYLILFLESFGGGKEVCVDLDLKKEICKRKRMFGKEEEFKEKIEKKEKEDFV